MCPINLMGISHRMLRISSMIYTCTQVHVVECKAKYPAHLAGLRDDDSIRACVVATKTEFEPLVTAVTKTKDDKSLKFADKLAKTLQQAAEERKEVILFIARWEQNTDTQL